MSALQDAIQRLKVRASSTPAKIYHLSDDLSAIALALDELDRRSALLAAMILRLHYWPLADFHPPQIEALAQMGPEASTIVSTATKEAQQE